MYKLFILGAQEHVEALRKMSYKYCRINELVIAVQKVLNIIAYYISTCCKTLKSFIIDSIYSEVMDASESFQEKAG